MSTPTAGTVVCYDSQDRLLLAVIKSCDARKAQVINAAGSEMSVILDRVELLPEKLRSDLPTAEYPKLLLALQQQAEAASSEIDLEMLWDSVQEQNSGLTCQQLCSVYFGGDTQTARYAMRLALAENKIYFRRDGLIFFPRNADSIEQLKIAAKAQAQQTQLRNQCLEFLLQRLKDKERLPVPPEIQSYMQTLIKVASGFDPIDPKTHKDVLRLLTDISDAANLKLHGDLRTQAYRLARATGLLSEFDHLAFIRNGVKTSFSESELQEVQGLVEKNSTLTFDATLYRDYRSHFCFTIDDQNTKDMDDALSIVKDDTGYELGIHITDVASLIPPKSTLFQSAAERATSIYCPGEVVHMLPKQLSEERLSLKPDAERKCLSLLFRLDQNYTILDFEVACTIIQSAQKMSYDEVDQLMLNRSNPHINLLADIANHQTLSRGKSGANNLPKRTLKILVGPSGKVSLQEQNEGTPAHLTVAEMMILANEYFAKFCDKNSIPVMYRCQKSPDPAELAKLAEVDDLNPAKEYLKRSVMKPSYLSPKAEPHYGLGLSHYLQATSPIRRLLDLCVQQQILAFLSGASLPYTNKEISDLAQDIEPRLSIANRTTRECERFWMLHYIKQNPELQESQRATVIRNDKKFALIEIQSLVMTCFCKIPKECEPGNEIIIRIKSVRPEFDELLLEFISLA
jgi:exoribonuclease II